MTKTEARRVENPEGKPIGRRTRNNYRDAVYELFEFAKKRRYVARGLPTAAADTDRLKVVAGKNHIITPEEAKRALGVLPPHLVPFTVLKLFSGLRTEEAYGLQWDELRFESKAVIIEAKLAKMRQRRVPPILSNLAKWLRPFRGLTGPINPEYSSPQAVVKAVNRESRKVNVILGRNTFRNCYITYRYAELMNPVTVAAEAGTSARMVESNYKELATKVDAKRWFSIQPSKSQLAALKEFVKALAPGAAPH
jgi:integrase